jgi:hypothetical protein
MDSMIFKSVYVACLENENYMASEINVEGDGSTFCNVWFPSLFHMEVCVDRD